MLKSIQLTGFKSFAKKGSLSFESSITAIVGPNGSGKSNTAEAFRFVLGEQGSKSMRVKKGTDLIWGGSHTLPKGSRAGVRVVLDNSKGKLNIDFEEVVIERSVLRDGTNEYSINGSKVRLKDVQDLLASVHVGSSGHHIISQGEADRVLGASPKERKSMIEDALGLKMYQLKKGEALRKLDAVAQNLEKAESRRRELLPQLTFLARQAQRVEQLQKVKQELKVLSQHYFSSEQDWIATESKELEQAVPGPGREARVVEQRIQDLRAAIELAKQQARESENQVNNTTEITQQRDKLVSLRSTFATLRTELGKVAGQLDMLAAVVKKARDLPSSISRKEVKVLIHTALQALDAGDVAQVGRLLHRFMQEKLEEQQVSAPQDDSLMQEKNALVKEQRELTEQLAGQEQAISMQEQVISNLQAQAQQVAQRETEHERDLYKETARYNELKAHLAELGRRQEGLTARRQALHENIGEVQILLGEELTMSNSITDDGGQAPARRDIERLKIQLEQQGAVSTDVIIEHKEAQEHYDFLAQEINDLQGASGRLTELVKGLDARMHEQFTSGLALINREFNTFFTTLFDGGGASLELQKLSKVGDIDEEQEVEYGVEVQVHLPRKKVTTLETLSGGERALASIALIFAMSQVNPPPFIILDETDAALDEANSQRYANIVKQLSERSQIILITHNRATMAAASTLYGVTMGSDGVSQLLSVKLTDAEAYAK